MTDTLRLPILLVISESPKVQFWIKKHLSEKFFLLFAKTRSQAMQALDSKLAFIVLDASMEHEDALLLSMEIRKKDLLIPIILMTGRLKKTFRDQAHRAGVNTFLSDQLDIQELESCLEAEKKTARTREKTLDLGQTLQKTQPTKSTPSSLKNKLVFSDAALKMLSKAQKDNIPVSSLFLRIDDFHLWENQEEISHSLSLFIQNLLREKDLLIPLSEGRFLLLFYNTFSEAAQKIAKRLKERIDAHPFSAMRKLSISIGVFERETTQESFGKLADLALKSIQTKPETNLIFSIMSQFHENS